MDTLQSLKAAVTASLNAAHEAVEAIENGTGTVEQLREANESYRTAFDALVNHKFGEECGE